MAHGGYILEFHPRGMIAALLARIAASGKVPSYIDGERRRVWVVIFVLALVLEAAFVDHVIVDDDRVAHLHGMVGV